MKRLGPLYASTLPEDTKIQLQGLTESAFGKFKDYVSQVMAVRKREVLAEKRVIDTTIWPME